MTLPARHYAELNSNLAKAREDSALLWRQLQIALGRVGVDAPVDDQLDVAPLPLKLKGRYLAGDGSEFDGLIAEISPRGLRIEGPWAPVAGAWSIANVPDVGIVEGPALDVAPGAFTLGVVAPPWRLQRLSLRFAWRLRRNAAEVEDRRRSVRVEMNRAKAMLRAEDGREYGCEVFDMSEGGAALHLGAGALYFWDNQPVALDGRQARVLRHFPGGLVVQFATPD